MSCQEERREKEGKSSYVHRREGKEREAEEESSAKRGSREKKREKRERGRERKREGEEARGVDVWAPV